MRRFAVAFATTPLLVPVAVTAAPAPQPRAPAQTIQPYFSDRLNWEHKRPEDVGMNPATLEEAVKLAIAAAPPATKNMADYWENDGVAVIRWIRGGDTLNNVVGVIPNSIGRPSVPGRQAAQ
jgi:hypothetical protein